MTVQSSPEVRTAMVTGIQSAIGGSPKIQLWGGATLPTLPVNCQAAATGTKLAEHALGAVWATESGGVLTVSGVPLVTTALADGIAAYYRIVDNAGTTCHEQGALAQPWAASTVYGAGVQRENGGNIYQTTTGGTSSASGGPTGTGSGIADGTAVWTYVTSADMVIDNATLANGQETRLTGFTKTAPGA